jgi:prepilin peptidase CpaA
MPWSDLLCWSLVSLVAGLAAWDDWHRLSIANRHSLVLALLFPLAVLTPSDIVFIPGALAGLITLIGGLLLYELKMMGAGDVKLASALALYIGLGYWAYFLLVTALAGGVICLLSIYWRRHSEHIPAWVAKGSWPDRLHDPAYREIPYGLAIAFAGGAVLGWRLLKPYFLGLS